MEKAYKINEEIVRQTLEVKFERNSIGDNDEWFICFSNPTAGPWKKIMFPTKDGRIKRIGGYEKEEKRPDLIVFSRTHQILLIIEAKDYLPELIKNSEKIEATFTKEYNKLSRLCLIKDEIVELTRVNGLVLFSKDIDSDYKKIIGSYTNTENFVVFFVIQKGNDLEVKIKTKLNDDLSALEKIIPFEK